MTDADWHTGYARAVTVYLNGDAITEPDTRGQRVRDDSFLLLLNAHSESITFRLPDESFGEHWEVAIDTATDLPAGPEPIKARDEIEVVDRGLLLLRRLSDGSP
jgi:glycogen operon protein